MVGVIEELASAREDFERGEWSAALAGWLTVDPAALSPEDLSRAGESAHLVGRHDLALDFNERAHTALLEAGEVAAAVRAAFHVIMIAATSGEPSRAAGWLATAERLLADLPADAVERGYIAFAQMFSFLVRGDLAAARACAEQAAEAGRAHGDGELVALGLCSRGRIAIRSGAVAEGLTLLDEAMTALLAHARSPAVFGNVYCTAIEGCQEVRELGRMTEWTSALQRWCESHPSLVAFTGQCSLHRGQILCARGALREAVSEFGVAIERYRRNGTLDAIGQAAYERGVVLRTLGDAAAAEASFRLAGEYGFDPQPGLALLWADRGEVPAATAAAHRLLAEVVAPLDRARVLPGVIEVLLAAGAVDDARACSAELDSLAQGFGFDAIRATAASSAAAVQIAAGDPAGALPFARKARAIWTRLRDTHAAASARATIGRALLALGDDASARVELDAARTALAELGATPAVRAIDRDLADPPAGRPGGLSEREVQVLRLVATGQSNLQVASTLVISERTVERHLSNIFTKIGVNSRTAAAAYAFEHDLA
ncbi:MAG TPA: helix-turn-helix transcriptional regulator [Nakamurella sp.]|nr:helix-turn-helix transcriptional regulator [Nakamurella sp.]